MHLKISLVSHTIYSEGQLGILLTGDFINWILKILLTGDFIKFLSLKATIHLLIPRFMKSLCVVTIN